MAPIELMDVDEVAKSLNITTNTIYRMIKAETIPTMRVGRVWRFDREMINLNVLLN